MHLHVQLAVHRRACSHGVHMHARLEPAALKYGRLVRVRVRVRVTVRVRVRVRVGVRTRG